MAKLYTNITENCKNVIARSSRTFAASFVINQTKYSDIKKITLSVPSTANGTVTIGGTISNSVEIITEKVNVLCGQKMEVFNSVKLDSGEYEDIPMGHFKITNASTKDSLTTIMASGPLSTETTLGYFSELEYPATTIQMLNEISQFIGVTIEVDNLEEIYVESRPEGYTYREVIGFIAAIHAMNAVENRNGTIALKWYKDSQEDIFTDRTDSPELSNTIFTVNKFECATGSNTWSKGNGSTGIVISNPLMTDSMADYVWEKLSGFCYRPGTFNIKSGTPCVDLWDSFLYNNERVIATELQYVYDGGLQNVYKAVGENETSNSYKGPVTKALERYYSELLVVKEIAADSMTIGEADIRYARMDQLDVIEANITSAVIDSIDGRYASIDYIQSNYISTLMFDALAGRVGDLETNSLTAESAVIKELEADITKTNTIIFGAAGGTSIQTEFSNAVIAILGDAQIKSAMIESLSADKVTAGTIYTDDVTIQSKSGQMLLKDNTLQISDPNRVRVQIGKDASNDYNMYVWDKTGNVMFDALGLTENGITRQIIRDDFVRDDANINAKKLDIDSLFTEINDSSNTIKSTKVYFDSESQTLDAVFKSMTTTVSGLQSTQSSQGTQISTIQGQLTSKIWQEDIDKAIDEVEGDVSTLNTQYSTLDQTISGLSSTVGSHTTQINSVSTRVTSAESTIEQHSTEIALKVNADGVINAINLSSEGALIQANKINLVGAVTFSSLDSSTQTKINTATSNASTALSTANTANTNASSALLRTEVEALVGNVKKFKNVCAYTKDNGTATGYLIITTPIQPNRMVTMHISGYNYVAENETIDLTVGFQIYSDGFYSRGFINNGSFPISSVQVAKVSSSDSRAVIIIGTATTKWAYSKIIVDEVVTGYVNLAPDSYKDGFTITITATLPTTYVHKATVSGTDLKTLSTATDSVIAAWCYNNDRTYINGGKIYAKSIKAASMDVDDLFALDITIKGKFEAITDDGTALITMNKGAISTYAKSSGYKGIELSGAYANVYAWNDNGDRVGYITSLKSDTYGNSIGVACESDNYIIIGTKGSGVTVTGALTINRDKGNEIIAHEDFYVDNATIFRSNSASTVIEGGKIYAPVSSKNIIMGALNCAMIGTYASVGASISAKLYVYSDKVETNVPIVAPSIMITAGVLAKSIMTTAGVDLDTLNSKVGNIKLTTVTIAASVSANAYVSPYTHYGTVSLASYVSKYGIPVRASALGGSGIPTPCHLRTDNVAVIVSNTASPTLVVTFMGGVTQTIV